jgi:hypothetical protein
LRIGEAMSPPTVWKPAAVELPKRSTLRMHTTTIGTTITPPITIATIVAVSIV